MATYYDVWEDHGVPIKPKNGKVFQLDELQELVGGFIEMIPLTNKMIAVVNEEGSLVDNPRSNFAATSDNKLSFCLFGSVLVAPLSMLE